MGTMRRQISSHGGWQFERATKRLGGWLAGFGLLSLNIGLFLLAATSLFLYNLYHDPQNIDVLNQLRIWALLIIFHAVAVTVFWIMSWAIRAEKPEPARPPRSEQPFPGPIPAIGSGDSYGGTRFRPTVSTPVLVDDLESEHFWRRRSTSILHRHEPGRQDTWQWSISDQAELTRTWPETTTQDHSSPTPELDAASAFDAAPEVDDGEIPTVGDAVAGVVYDPIELERSDDEEPDEPEEPQKPQDSVIDPLRVASRQPESNTAAGGDGVLTRWLWVEAAAAAWLAQREDEVIDEKFVPPSADGSDAEAY
jgi:hypothetical protein